MDDQATAGLAVAAAAVAETAAEVVEVVEGMANPGWGETKVDLAPSRHHRTKDLGQSCCTTLG